MNEHTGIKSGYHTGIKEWVSYGNIYWIYGEYAENYGLL